MQLHSSSWELDEKNKHIAKVLTLENVTMINIQLKAGEAIAEHDSEKEVLIVVRKGSVTFTVDNKEVLVNLGSVLHLDPFEKHSLLANIDSDILVLQIQP